MKNKNLQLVICGFNILFWELLLIRWLGSSIRIVAYYANFVLIAAFFGLGLGALCSRHTTRRWNLLFPIVALGVLSGWFFGRIYHPNPISDSEFIWLGTPEGFVSHESSLTGTFLPLFMILPTVYVITALVFTVFGQWLGLLFRDVPPLKAYSLEILGSMLGIFAFAGLSFCHLQPLWWVVVGGLGLFALSDFRETSWIVPLASFVLMCVCVMPSSIQTFWSPYYKIQFEPMLEFTDTASGANLVYSRPFGYSLTVNNDFHQMLLDLREGNDHNFFNSWRVFYEKPYDFDRDLPPGPILVVGAGTGNDVAAALRKTQREVVAVEIDPLIAQLGKNYHFEKPYQSSRVHIVIDDARSFFHKTRQKFALVVFGFLDSHTLTSSFSSLRLDNFVYTLDSLHQVKNILLPGGQVALSFASNREWIHQRFLAMLSQTFGPKTEAYLPDPSSYSNGIIYHAFNEGVGTYAVKSAVPLPTDDWPFLYLARKEIPRHYQVFMGVVLILGFAGLLVLPKGQRQLHLPFFFMGAAFFLLETSNVVTLSLLFGSTWVVNLLVFAGILGLILLGNLSASKIKVSRMSLNLLFFGLAANLLLSYFINRAALLPIASMMLKCLLAILIYLGPVYFAAVIFGLLIRNEPRLYQAYGSNLLGAVIGGVCEYTSMIYGFKFLLILTAVFYGMAYISIPRLQTRRIT